MKNKIMSVLLAIVLVTVIYSGCISTTNTNSSVTTTIKANVMRGTLPPMNNVKITQNMTFDEFMGKFKQRRIFSDNGSSVPDRGSYGIPLEVFKNLPPLPVDFLYKVYMIKLGKFFDIGNMDESYWKQPEFDPEFTRMGLRYWKEISNNDYKKTHWSASGVRSYPFEQYVSSKPGYSFNVSVIFSTDWSVEAYQGVRIVPKFLSNATYGDGKFVTSTSDASDYISVNVTPQEFLLTPAYPMFTQEWNKKLTFTGKISEKTPPGTYILSYDIQKPRQENSDKWFMQYLNLYSEGVQLVKSDKPYLQAIITVT